MATNRMTMAKDGSNRERIAFRVGEHYINHEDSYNAVFDRMKRCNDRFRSVDRGEKIHMLKRTYTFAVLSVQTPVDRHESAYEQMWENDEPVRDTADAVRSNSAGPNGKIEHIRTTLRKTDMWVNVADLLTNPSADDLNSAHKLLLDEAGFVGPAKVPFMLAMLGFEEKCCIDSNVQDVCDVDKPTTVVPERYDRSVEKAFRQFDHVLEGFTAFQKQWILFAAGREQFADHDHFYNSLGIPE